MRLLIRCLSPMFQLSHANKERASIDAMVRASIDAMDLAMDTRKTTMMNEMNKQIEDLRPSQTQQTEGIQKELRGEIDELKAMMEKYFANTPPPTMQHEGSSGLTSAEKSNELDPLDCALGKQKITLEEQIRETTISDQDVKLHDLSFLLRDLRDLDDSFSSLYPCYGLRPFMAQAFERGTSWYWPKLGPTFAYGVDRTVVLDLAGTNETPETVREGYYGAYLSFFQSCGLTFPIPEPILEVLAELGLSLTQLLPNFLRHLVAFLVKAREEVLAFGLSEFRQLVLVKRNKQNPGTFLVSPRPGRHIIEDIPYRDEKWREQFFVFMMDRASMGDFDFSQLPWRWAENIVPSGLMSDEIRNLMRSVQRATPSVQTQSSDRLPRQLVRRSSFRTSVFASRGRVSGKFPLISIHDSDDEDFSGETRPSVSSSPGSEDETVAATHKRRRSSEGDLTGPSHPRFVSEGDGSSFAAQSDLISLAGRMRSAGCRLPSLTSSVEREAYAKVVVASSKVMEAFNEYVVMMEDHVVASRNDKEIESICSEIKRLSEELEATKREGKKDAKKIKDLTEDRRGVHLENETLTSQMVAQSERIAALEVERDRDIRCASRIARRDIAAKYREVLQSLKGRWASKKKEVSAEIRLQEVTANIDLLNELKDGGLTVDAELARLKGMKGDCEDLVALAAVPDWSISELDLPQVSDDYVDQVGGSNMTSRRSNSRDFDRVRTRTGSANAERIRSGDVSDALSEVLCEETQLPRPSTQGAKDPEGEKSVARVKSSIPMGSEGRDRPPKKAKTNGSDSRLGLSGKAAVPKPFHGQFSHSKDCPITEDPDSVAHLVRHFKPAGCPLPSLRNMTEREAYVKMAVAHAKAMEANNEFAATLEKRMQDVPRSGELDEIKKVVRELKLGLKMAQDRERANAAQLAAAEKLGNQAASLEAHLRVVSNERKSALEQVSFLEAKVESSANKFSDDLHRATREAKKTMVDSYLDVLVSLKEKWEKKKAATDCEARLWEVVANIDLLKEIMSNNLLASDELLRLRAKEIELGSEVDVMATSDFSVGKLDLPQISEDLPEDFFDKVPSAADDVAKCSGDHFEDGEFSIEE
ncbi:hypothetical protein F2Q70_00003628 [Brassica cretica]|uniref:Uncharacterized protein n=1 Tax=Brassica cretica TaxID=69181 RepID=A0A8S9INH0_BRACR|nr:hypothetical protein F2Q70_00003628 [Brassica cretica]